MLLLVMQTYFHHLRNFRSRVLSEQFLHRVVDVLAVIPHLFDRWPRKHTTLRARKLFAHSVVVGIEEVLERVVAS